MVTEYSMEWLDNITPPTWANTYIGTVRRAIFRGIAHRSAELEGYKMIADQWELFTDVIQGAYERGLDRGPLDIYHFLKWHGGILPFGGTLRQCGVVSAEMGRTFRPALHSELPRLMPEFIKRFNAALPCAPDPYRAMADLHFDEWRTHYFLDGNKRHCRLLTVYACGFFDLPPVDITLAEKSLYLDALATGNMPALAELFSNCQA
jgi:hypothetical protein